MLCDLRLSSPEIAGKMKVLCKFYALISRLVDEEPAIKLILSDMKPPSDSTRIETRCPGCYSDRVVPGRIGDTSEWCGFTLASQGTGFWRTLGPSVEVEKEGFLCVDRGLVWSHANKEAGLDAITRGGSDELLSRLRLAARPRRRWWWRLFGER